MKKRLACVLTIVMCLSQLAGCGKKTASTQNGKPVLRVLVQWSDMDYSKYPIGKMLEEKTGYSVVYETLPSSKPEDKLNLLISSQEEYDLITVPCSATMKSLFFNYVEKGAIEPLDKYIESTQNLKNVMNDHEFDSIKVDGKSYAVPTASNPDLRGGMFIRTDWLEKLGLEMPQTIDEFTKVLEAFKQSNLASGASGVIPLTSDSTAVINNLVGAFGLACEWNDVDGKLVNRAQDPRMKEYLSYINMLYTKGLLDPEFPTNKYNTIQEKFTTGQAGVAYFSWWDTGAVLSALKESFPDATADYMPVLTGPDGYKGVDKQHNLEMLSFVPKASKHKKEVIDWIDKKLDKEVFKDMFVGVEGVHHEVKDGEYYPIQPKFTDERNEAAKYRTGILKEDYAKYLRARRRQDEVVFKYWKELNQEMPEDDIVTDYIGLVPYLPVYTSECQVFSAFAAENYINFAAGTNPLSKYDEFVDKCNDKKLDVMTDEINGWYTEFRKG